MLVFFFEVLEEAFAARVIQVIGFLVKRLNDIKREQKLPEGKGSIQEFSISVDNEPIRSV